MFTPEKEAFFDRLEQQDLSLTFNDVRLRTAPSEVGAHQVGIASRFSRNVDLKVPIVSAAMDTVTTSDMAIAMAELGGIGIVHAGLSSEEQKKEVRRVKLSLNRLIETPVSFDEDRTIESILNECEDRRLDFRTFPVIDADGKFVGLLSQNDFEFSDSNDKAQDAMTPKSEIISMAPGTNIADAYDAMRKNKKKTLPLVGEDGRLEGMYLYSDARRKVEEDKSPFNLDSRGRLRVGAAIPTGESALERLDMIKEYVDVVVIDSAAGDSQFGIRTLKDVVTELSNMKGDFPDIDVVVGNVSEGVSARLLVANGADGVKVGQGPGSICTTRQETGIGRPQVSAVAECHRAIGDTGVPICADGGIVDKGDASIAIASGANSIMLGSLLAGTDESPGEIKILSDNSRVKAYRGMGSLGAMRDSVAARLRYGQDNGSAVMLAEGVEGYVPYKGSVHDVVGKLVLALRKSMAYVNAPDIESHIRETKLTRITNSGIAESRPHDIIQ